MDADQVKKIVRSILEPTLSGGSGREIGRVPIAISNRHIHLSASDVEILFGPGYQLRVLKELSQPGQYAYHETVTLVGPKGVIEAVRVLGPPRTATQVEISCTDTFRLGVRAPVRDSGTLQGTPGLTVVGPAGCRTIETGVIIARRHIHLHTRDALEMGLADKQVVNVLAGAVRPTLFCDVLVRVADTFAREMHLDVDEGNAAALKNGDAGLVIGDIGLPKINNM
ncbi:MAG: hypothetical protein CVV64_17955 [Candidatus Wallbacteria bacterium HGW-Wallbacteria-1]|jgi:propanediol utilization protein|uniref:Phosphate propanoyltransferase n=1 Tax=Candidatus Wallbacteria bacterium HGW-Wallbacteria-1 TaxID=2013854 RepID=A0A2N1PJV9_9BACT|nr:MAG: hypothetical protein CVV64_17955 [Candidatus Wallbacteria bacterium HGW-Wallbacteria-1]